MIVSENRSVVPRSFGNGEYEYKGKAQRSFESDGASPYPDCSCGYTNLYLGIKTQTVKRKEGRNE